MSDEQMSRADMDLIMDIPVKLSIEIGRTQMTVRELMKLGPGSVVQLEQLAGEPLPLRVNDQVVAHGEIMVQDEKFALRITDINLDTNS